MESSDIIAGSIRVVRQRGEELMRETTVEKRAAYFAQTRLKIHTLTRDATPAQRRVCLDKVGELAGKSMASSMRRRVEKLKY